MIRDGRGRALRQGQRVLLRWSELLEGMVTEVNELAVNDGAGHPVRSVKVQIDLTMRLPMPIGLINNIFVLDEVPDQAEAPKLVT